MELRRITFEGDFPEPHLSIDCWPPFPEVNVIFRAAFKAFVQPYELAVEAGKLSEATAVKLMIQAYSEGVIAKSLTPGFEKMKPADWRDFFKAHPDHFEELRANCESPANWDSVNDRGMDHGRFEAIENA